MGILTGPVGVAGRVRVPVELGGLGGERPAGELVLSLRLPIIASISGLADREAEGIDSMVMNADGFLLSCFSAWMRRGVVLMVIGPLAGGAEGDADGCGGKAEGGGKLDWRGRWKRCCRGACVYRPR